MKTMPLARQLYVLARLGLPRRTARQRRASWKDYQRSSTWSARPLKVDGIPGPKTIADVAIAARYGYRVSEHFHLSEFRCGCRGRYHPRAQVQLHRELVNALEQARDKVYRGGRMTIVSGWRCRQFNRTIGGLDAGGKVSAHVSGQAADITRKAGPQAFIGLGFHGIGYKQHGLVTHVDVAPWLRKNATFQE